MKELITIRKNKMLGKSIVNARDLYVYLEVGKDFSTWLKNKIKKYGFIENVDYVRTFFDVYGNEIINSNERIHKIEYGLTMNMAKELAMVQNNERGRLVRLYFIEAEKIYRQTRFIIYLNEKFLIPCFKQMGVYKTYLLRDTSTNLIKIGKSMDVSRRTKQIKSHNPSVELLMVVDNNIELMLHHDFEGKRIFGEWFELNESDVAQIKLTHNGRTY